MKKRIYILLLALTLPLWLRAQTNGQPFLCEFGVQAGCGYYVGDGAEHIFMNPREAFGLQFRYKFTKRWALQVKAASQRITGWNYDVHMQRMDTKWQNQLINIDVMAEFNFFRFDAETKYDRLVKPYTPYIFLGIGTGVYGANGYQDANYNRVMAYFPFGIGFKWKFSERAGLNIAWQHNVYFADNLENSAYLDDRFELNGSNIMNCDLTGMITAGIVVEFARAKKPCRICNW